jgi:DNA-binding response OmpR family regulator
MQQKVLFIEDQEDLGNVIKQFLQIMKFEVNWCTNARQAISIFKQDPHYFDILVIDVELPGMDGFQLAEEIVGINDLIPFLFLTARNDKKDRIHGLNIGADDYISKPFDIDELVLRIRNILRRNHPSSHISSECISIGDLKLHRDLLKLYVNDKQLGLTLREAELLEYLCNQPNKVLKREDILTQLWGENDYFLGRSLDVFISRLRKLLSNSNSVSIENVYGIGFVLTVRKN